mmetsp:Transcript_121429/g.303027  ORF Transcript_121429/g.303027 Transcript_121429/m.303027 type:complete len:147 (+) Transcript_121429:2106-2546(+)
MKLPTSVDWPRSAITFLLMGGRDNFRGAMSPEAYIADAKSRVPKENRTTAILFVNEMPHMPQCRLLAIVLPIMLKALLAWKDSGAEAPPKAELKALLAKLTEAACWSGRLLYTQGAGAWQDTEFGPPTVPAKLQQMAVTILRRHLC